MDDQPAYVPAFLMAGQQYQRLDRREEAKAAFYAGIEAAKRQGDDHARDELTRFLGRWSDFMNSMIRLSLTDDLLAFVDANSGDGTLYATPVSS